MLIQVRVRAILQFYSNRKRASLFPTNRFCINSILLLDETNILQNSVGALKKIFQCEKCVAILWRQNHPSFKFFTPPQKRQIPGPKRPDLYSVREKKNLDTNGQKLKCFFAFRTNFRSQTILHKIFSLATRQDTKEWPLSLFLDKLKLQLIFCSIVGSLWKNQVWHPVGEQRRPKRPTKFFSESAWGFFN